MQRAAVLMALVALSGCEDPHSFNQQYEETTNEIEQRASNLDIELNKMDANELGEKSRSQ